MRSPAAAIAWEFRQHYRWGFFVALAYLLALAVMKVAILEPLNLSEEGFAFAVIVPATSLFICFLAIFTFGLSGDVAAQQSIFPARFFTLPVPTPSLAAWPMLYGGACMVMLWLATRLLAPWPARVEVPWIWPAMFGASMLAWTQALMWLPYPFRGMRVVVSVLWLTTIDAVVMLALHFKASEAIMITLLAPHIPLAYLTARFAVARARRGDVSDWRRAFAPRERSAALREPFVSAARAQVWFEWRQFGRSLPILIGIVVPCELALLFVFRQTPEVVFATLVLALLTPAFMAAFVAATVRKPHTSFTSTRPVAGTALVSAKLKAAMWSALAAWLIVAIATLIALRWSGASAVVIERAHRLAEIVGTPRAIVMILLAVVLFITSTWKQLVQSLYIGMSGREWIAKASVFAVLSVLTVFFPVAVSISDDRRALALVLNNVTAVAVLFVILKLSSAVWVAMRLHDLGLLRDRTLIVGAISWDVAVFTLYGVLMWLFPGFLLHPSFLAIVAILAVPLTRVSAAPLALEWGRHQ